MDEMNQATMASRVLGIDFGTTNTVVAVMTEDGVEVVLNDIGYRTTPSVVHIDPADPSKHCVGEVALRLRLKDPQDTICNVKRVLGFPTAIARHVTALGPVKVLTSDHGDAVTLKLSGDTKTTPEEVVAMIFLELKKAAEHHLGEYVTKAVIAVPSYFTAAQRQAIRDAATLANLKVVEIVNETTAAALAYAYDKEYSKTAMIVDVGGGGCCISVVRVENNDVSVLACSARQPGGENFDARMVDYLKKAVAEQYKKDVVDLRSEEILRSQWVEAKIKLSRLPQTNIQTYLPEIKTEFRTPLTHAEFNSECLDLFQHIIAAIHATLKRAQVEANNLDDVILVGGSSRIVKLRELIIEAVGGGGKFDKAVNPDEVVALGAALLGAKCVQIKREVLGLHTCLTILDSDKQETNEHWPNNVPLPVSYVFKSLPMNNSKNIEIKQGHQPKTLTTVCLLPIPQKAENVTINTQGVFSLRDAGKNKISAYLRGCIPEVTLKSLKAKMQTHVQSSLKEASRMESKNALEDVLRQGKSWKISEDEPFPEKYSEHRQKCIDMLNRLDQNALLKKEEFDKIRLELEHKIVSLQEESKKEKRRLQERDALTVALKSAIKIEIPEDSPMPTHHREKFITELNCLAQHADVKGEDFDEICTKMFQTLQEECKKEKQRVQERTAFKEVLDHALALDMKAVEDEFKETALCLRDVWNQEVEWLLENSQASAEEYSSRRNNVIHAKTSLINDCAAAIQKRRNALRELLQTKLRGSQTFATQKKQIEDELDYQWGTKLETICRDRLLWLKVHPNAAEDELKQHISQLDKDNINLDKKFQQLKSKRDFERRAAYTNAKQAVLEGVHLKIAEFKVVQSDALNYVKKCEDHLEWLKKNPCMNASDYTKVSSEVENGLTNLRSLCMAEVTRLQRRKSLQNFLETALKAGEPLRTFAHGLQTWLELHPQAARDELEKVTACVEEARRSLQEADVLAEAAGTKRGRAAETMQGMAQSLGLQLQQLSAVPTDEAARNGGYSPAKLQAASNKQVVMKGVTSLSLGVATPDGRVAVLIPRNTPLPYEITRTFTTASDDQEEAEFLVCRGEEARWEHNHVLGDFTLAVPAGPKGQVDIDTTFSLDAGGVLTVTAVERSSKEEANVTLQCEGASCTARATSCIGVELVQSGDT